MMMNSLPSPELIYLHRVPVSGSMPVGPMGAPLPSGPIPGPPPPGPGPNLPPGANIPGPNGRGPPGGAVHPSLLDPLTNNAPLQFNTAKGKPPMPIDGALDEELIGRKEIRETKDGEIQPATSPIQQPDGSMGGPGGRMMSPMMGPMMGNPMMGHLQGGDPNMMMMGPMGFPQFMGPVPMGLGPPPNPGEVPQKEIIHCKSVTCFPPPPGAPPPSTRERPPGCRTIFVGGLPENCTEDIIREIFEGCGNICSIRLSKKNFAHIRFFNEESVHQALYLSGYRLRIGSNDDKPNTGRLHVDYAQARDDLYEWECTQRALAREHRHRMRIEQERLRPPSPPPIIHFSDHEASVLLEKLKADDTFMKGAQVLITWLERGDCSRRSANSFYSMIQSTNSHVRRLMNEKGQHDEELQAIKEKFRQRLEGILRQFDQIEKVFTSASKQKAWDHFSKAQRKNIDMWRKQAQEIKSSQTEEFLRERQEDEMEMSDNEDIDSLPPLKKKRPDEMLPYPGFPNSFRVEQESHQLKEENDSLKCQLEAYKNEVDLIKHESKNGEDEKDKQVKALQQALQGMQQQLIEAKTQLKRSEELANELKLKNGADPVTEPKVSRAEATSTAGTGINEREARLIGLISTFLHVHPFGASVDYIWSYLQRLDIVIRSSEIEDLLEKLPSVFRQDLHGVGASIEKRWRYLGLDTASKIL